MCSQASWTPFDRVRRRIEWVTRAHTLTTAQSGLSQVFIDRLKNYDKDNINPKLIAKIREKYEQVCEGGVQREQTAGNDPQPVRGRPWK